MNISENAQSTTKAICAELGIQPDEQQSRQVTRLIERSIISALLSETERHTHLVMNCCSADLDMAHKLTSEIRAATDALVANLSSLR